jgi:WD40 repeat protein
MTTFMPPPPAATFLAFHPQDNNIIAIGMEDSTIQIYNVRVDEVCYHVMTAMWSIRVVYIIVSVSLFSSLDCGLRMFLIRDSLQVKSKLKGHQKRITGLAFSNSLNVLVSSGADAQVHTIAMNKRHSDMHCFRVQKQALVLSVSCSMIRSYMWFYLQLCMWGTDGWEKRKSKFVQVQPGGRSPSMGDTRVQFHNDQVRLLVVHESQLAVYDASKLDRIRQVGHLCLMSANFDCFTLGSVSTLYSTLDIL